MMKKIFHWQLLVCLLLIATSATRAGQPGLIRSEFVFEAAPFPSCHASTIAETADGLVVAFFGGTHERHPDVGIWVSRNSGDGWSVPVEVATGTGFGTNRFPTWNPVLFQPAKGPLMLFYKVGPSPSEWWGMLITSSDNGKTWSPPVRLPEGVLGPIKNKPVQLANGDILSPSSKEGGPGWRVHFERSIDGGRTWTAGPAVNDGKAIGAIQPSILVHSDTRLQAIGRTRQGRIFEVWSEDAGRTWGPMSLTQLPNPNSGTDTVTLRDGRHLLVYNHNPSNKGRKPLNVALSKDGIHWDAALILESDFSKRDGYAYPSVIQSRDGLVHIVYTWDRKRIKYALVDPRRLQTRPILNGAWPGEINSIGVELAAIPAGSFVQGDMLGDWDERETNGVTITAPFKISMDEITLGQYQAFRPGHRTSLNGQATGVRWQDAVSFCRWLSKKEGKPYRLPTEAEWEFACRASTTDAFWSGDEPPPPSAPNAWNLRGMHDEVMEWCADWYAPYSFGAKTNPLGPANGVVKVVRGGKPDDDERLKDEPGRKSSDYHRSANRAGLPPGFGVGGSAGAQTNGFGQHDVGIRVVQAPLPAGAFEEEQCSPLARLVLPPPPTGILKQAPARPYFRKRALLPIPPDNARPEEIKALGLHPSFRYHNHSPALEVCPNGDVLLVIYTSNFEYEPGVSLITSRLRFGAEEWDFPEPFYDTPDVNEHAPLLFTDWTKGDRMWLFWGWPRMAAGAFPFQWMTSQDSGATWSPVQFPKFATGVGPHSRQPINTAFRGPDSTLYVASDAEKTNSVLWISRNNGKTWEDRGGRSAGRHTTYALRNDGSILGMGGKSTDIEGYMPKAISRDGGRTWSVSKTPFPAQGVNQRPSLLRLQSGKLLFAGDFQRRGNIAPPRVTDRGCYVALSRDEGETWIVRKLPGTQPHEKPEYQKDPDTLGYTAMRQAPNGMIHLITTMNTPCLHFEFNEAWLNSDEHAAVIDTQLPPPTASSTKKPERFRRSVGGEKVVYSGSIIDGGGFLLQGPMEWTFSDGKKHYQANYALGRKVDAEILWSKAGSKIWERAYRTGGSWTWTQYWDNGSKRSESNWDGFKASGRARLWDRSGQVISDKMFASGKLVQ